jgi:hypothetical protein
MVLLERRQEGQRESFSWVRREFLMNDILSALRSCIIIENIIFSSLLSSHTAMAVMTDLPKVAAGYW